MELLQLKYFCHAAETENFSETARFFLVPPSNISQSIKRLEQELDVSLFDRRANRITLSHAGKGFYRHTKAALQELHQGAEEVQKAVLPPRLKICIKVNRRITMQAIEQFRRLCPEVDLIVRHHETADDTFDLIIDASPHQEEGYHAAPLLSEEIVLAVRQDSPIATHPLLTKKELASQPFITMNSGDNIHTVTREVCGAMGFEPRIAIQSDDPFYIRQCVELGLGVAVIPALSWRGQFSEKVLFKPLIGSFRTTYVCHRNAPATQKFVQILKDEFQKEEKTAQSSN